MHSWCFVSSLPCTYLKCYPYPLQSKHRGHSGMPRNKRKEKGIDGWSWLCKRIIHAAYLFASSKTYKTPTTLRQTRNRVKNNQQGHPYMFHWDSNICRYQVKIITTHRYGMDFSGGFQFSSAVENATWESSLETTQ